MQSKDRSEGGENVNFLSLYFFPISVDNHISEMSFCHIYDDSTSIMNTEAHLQYNLTNIECSRLHLIQDN